MNSPRLYLSAVPKVYWVALIPRLLWALLIPVIPLSDSLAYDTFAFNIWQHGTYGWEAGQPFSYWPVGTSAIYAGFFYVFGYVYWPIVLFHIALSLGVIFFSQKLCDRFFETKAVGALVAYILALWPTMIMYTTVLASELLYMFFSVAGIYWFTKLGGNFYRNAMVAALLFTVAYYIRPLITVVIVIMAFSSIVLLKERWQPVAVKTLISFGVLALLVAPWAYRNYQLHDAFVPMSSNSGAVFWMGNQPGTTGGYMSVPQEFRGMDTQQMSELLKAQAMEYIKEHPGEFVKNTLFKLYLFHSYETIGVTWNEEGIKTALGQSFLLPLKVLSQLYWLALVLSAFAGLGLYLKGVGLWRFLFHPFVLLWASSAAIHSLIVAQDRYHIPSVGFIAAFSAYAILYCWQRRGRLSSLKPASRVPSGGVRTETE